MAIRMTGLTSGLNTESIVEALMSAQRTKQTKVENKKQKLEWKQEVWSSLNTKLYNFYKTSLGKMKLQTNYKTKAATSSDSTKVTAETTSDAVVGTYSVKIDSLASAQYVTSGKINGVTTVGEDGSTSTKAASTSTKLSALTDAEGNSYSDLIGTTITISSGTTTKTLEIDENTTIANFVSKCQSAGLNASYDTSQQRFFISSSDSGEENSFTISSTDNSTLSALGLSEVTGEAVTAGTDTNAAGMVVKEASDSVIEYNGAELTSSTTEITVAGVTLSLLGTTGGDTVNVTVTNDTSSIYDSIKEFLTEYNSILSEMNTYYNASSSSDYDVLSDDEKEAMTDDEIEKWEDKIKDSLLRRDDTLSSLISSFRSDLMGTVTVNGTKYSLATLGITTSAADYTEGGLLHIKGDEDDTEYADDTNTLEAMLASDPDTVMSVMTGLLGNLYSDLTKKMSTSTLSSTLTFYNDKEMASQLSDYKTEISEWEDKLATMEDRYYSQFTAMETALTKLQSKQSALSSLIGS